MICKKCGANLKELTKGEEAILGIIGVAFFDKPFSIYDLQKAAPEVLESKEIVETSGSSYSNMFDYPRMVMTQLKKLEKKDIVERVPPPKGRRGLHYWQLVV